MGVGKSCQEIFYVIIIFFSRARNLNKKIIIALFSNVICIKKEVSVFYYWLVTERDIDT